MGFEELDKFMEAIDKIDQNSDPKVDGFDFGPVVPKGVKKNHQIIQGASKQSDEVISEGILQKGKDIVNKISSMIPLSLKARLSGEWKHLNDDEKLTLLRIINGDEKAYSVDSQNIDVELAKAFREKRLVRSDDSEDPSLIVNENLDLSRTASKKWPSIRVEKVNGTLLCNYSSFESFARFPREVTALQMKGNKAPIKDFNYFPTITGRGDKNYAIDMTGTKISSLSGWAQRTAINGHVGFNDCNINDLTPGNGTIFIDGALDIRNNKNIRPETLKSILTKGGGIVVKGGILHTLDVDGYYDAKKVKSDVVDSQDLGLLEASVRKPKRDVNIPVKQSYLWEIGSSILQMAMNKGVDDSAKTTTEKVRNAINPEVSAKVRELAANIVANQANPGLARQSSQTLISPRDSDDIKQYIMKLVDQLSKQITSMNKTPHPDDSVNVEKTSTKIINSVVDEASTKINEFIQAYEKELNGSECPNFPELISKLDETIVEVPEVASGKLRRILDSLKKVHMAFAKNDRVQYDKTLYGLLHLVNSELLEGKSNINEEDSTNIVNRCFKEEQVAPAVQEPEEVNPATFEPATPSNTPKPTTAEPISLKRKPTQVPNLKQRPKTVVKSIKIDKEPVAKKTQQSTTITPDFKETTDDANFINDTLARIRNRRSKKEGSKKDET